MKNKDPGPLFILGKPRSGTKLLARLLGQHPDIALSISETLFIPYFLKNPSLIENLEDKSVFDNFYSIVSRGAYFHRLRKHKTVLTSDKWYNICDEHSFYGVIAALLRHYSGKLHKKNSIPGDKSNNYVKNVPELKKQFPNAKFIHIVRDVRDASLSSHKAWKTNFKRYAQRWTTDSLKCSSDLGKLKDNDYIETRYEDLLSDPKTVIKDCLSILELEFFDKIIEMQQPSEKIGDAKGSKKIVSTNLNKYKNALNARQIEDIEKIALPGLERYEYDFSYKGIHRPLSDLKMKLYQGCDVFHRFLFDINDKRNRSFTHLFSSMIYRLRYKN